MAQQPETPSITQALGWFVDIVTAVVKALPRQNLKELAEFWKKNGALLSLHLSRILLMPVNHHPLRTSVADTGLPTLLLPDDLINLRFPRDAGAVMSISRGGGGVLSLSGSSKVSMSAEPISRNTAIVIALRIANMQGLRVATEDVNEERLLVRLVE